MIAPWRQQGRWISGEIEKRRKGCFIRCIKWFCYAVFYFHLANGINWRKSGESGALCNPLAVLLRVADGRIQKYTGKEAKAVVNEARIETSTAKGRLLGGADLILSCRAIDSRGVRFKQVHPSSCPSAVKPKVLHRVEYLCS